MLFIFSLTGNDLPSTVLLAPHRPVHPIPLRLLPSLTVHPVINSFDDIFVFAQTSGLLVMV